MLTTKPKVTLINLKGKLKNLREFVNQRYSIPPEMADKTQFFSRSEKMFREILNVLETMTQLIESYDENKIKLDPISRSKTVIEDF